MLLFLPGFPVVAVVVPGDGFVFIVDCPAAWDHLLALTLFGTGSGQAPG